MTIYFCISSRTDPAIAVLERLLRDFPTFDAKVFVEAEDPNLQESAGQPPNLGPNPKIRNMSRGYKEAKGDVLWVLDCNVWVGKGVAGRMVDRLCGIGAGAADGKPYKFVHQLPLVVDVYGQKSHPQTSHLARISPILQDGGGRLEELFLASSHAKFYTAINTVLVAPCIVGKSNMFRRSHLNHLTSTNASREPGIDFFSDNICEDHLIGDLLWKGKVPEEESGDHWGKHALLFGDLAIQPMAGMSVREYIARRVRWLRVRKFTVTLATFVEPGTESLLCSCYGAYGMTSLPWCNNMLGIPQSWAAFALLFLLSVSLWTLVDWTVYLKLHCAATIEEDQEVPAFARPPTGRSRRPYKEWLFAWLGRELLALPIWTWAFWGGTEVVWRGTKFWVGMDMRVHQMVERDDKQLSNGHENGLRGRSRKDL